MQAMATMLRLGFALLAGFVVFTILVPTSGAGTRCYSLLAFEVPCEGGLAVAAGTASAAVVGVALWLTGRARHPRMATTQSRPIQYILTCQRADT